MSVSSEAEFEAARDLLCSPGFSFIVLEVEQGVPRRPKPLANYEGPEIKYRFARYLEREYGIPVLGRLGY
jgi:hypothetical protein